MRLTRTIAALVITTFFITGYVRTGTGEDDYMKLIKKVGGDDNKQYFLFAPEGNTEGPKHGRGLLVIMPGGDGSATFYNWCKSIYKNSLGDDYIAVQPVAKRWGGPNDAVWPTKHNKAGGMKFTTEEFIFELIAEVSKTYKLDANRIFTLSWSSSGPAAYAISVDPASPVTGSFVAMSVYYKAWMPKKLDEAANHAYYVYHSPDDKVCKYELAQQAARDLAFAGARVAEKTYEGAHGWGGPGGPASHLGRIKKGVNWLEANAAARKSQAVAAYGKAPKIDGTIKKSEWAGATEIKLNGGETIYLKHDFVNLYVGIKAKANGIGSIAVSKSTGLHILHASASLGEAVLKQDRDRETWDVTTPFKWERNCDKFLKEKGWAANLMSKGAKSDMEYVISLEYLGIVDEHAGEQKRPFVRIASRFTVAYYYMSGRKAKTFSWPEDIEDGTVDERLLSGNAPKGLKMRLSAWGIIRGEVPTK